MNNKQNAERLILVTGATGKQGGVVAQHLLKGGFRIRALTRNPDKPAARALAEQGADVVQGNLDDRASIEQAIKGIYGVFSIQNSFEAGSFETGYEGEVRQGVTLANAAKAVGVQHFVYSSAGYAHRQTGIPHVESKWQVEKHIREIALPYTILRPAFLMENWEMMRDSILDGTLVQPLNPDTPLQQVCVDDVGAFAAMVFDRPDNWLSREVDVLAGDELTMTEVAQTFSRVIGRQVSYVQLPWDQFHQSAGEEVTIMYKWFNNVHYEADIAALHEEYPQLATLEQYLHRSGWKGAKLAPRTDRTFVTS